MSCYVSFCFNEKVILLVIGWVYEEDLDIRDRKWIWLLIDGSWLFEDSGIYWINV